MHQKACALDGALFNTVLGIAPGTTSKEILASGRKQLRETYPHVIQIDNEKVTSVKQLDSGFQVGTNKKTY